MSKHTVASVVRVPGPLPEVKVTMGSGRAWCFRKGMTGKTHLMATGLDHPSRHPEYKPAKDAANRALIGAWS